MNSINAKTLERVYIYIYIDKFRKIKNNKINIKKIAKNSL